VITEQADVLELLARGAAAGLSLLLAIVFFTLRNGNWAARLGGLFALGTASYSVFGSPLIAAALAPADLLLAPLSIFNAVFFWWFTTALFDDHFQWRVWRFVPLILVAILATAFFTIPAPSVAATAVTIAWQILTLAIMTHAVLLAIRDLRDDLVEPRRQFRIALTVLVALVGMATAIIEILYSDGNIPPRAAQLQSAALFGVSLALSTWILQARPSLFAVPPRGRPRGSHQANIAPEDIALSRHLTELMAAGIYRESVLTVGALAERLKTPEHRLRKLINQGLGYRNFSGFLNTYRIADAQAVLADPERARDQILLIALDLGFGSIAPFNRAFREATGQTPTAYRRKALTEA
tara:strand:- start:20081 stop:21139 length:1059 start_codon:yes stop_codon:yes gene_type:complete